MALSGFFKLVFSAQLPGAGGVAVLDGGRVHGGDTQYLYAGSFEQRGEQLTATIRVVAHAGAALIAFRELGGAFDLKLTGTAIDLAFSLSGASPIPGATITVMGHRIATIDLR